MLCELAVQNPVLYCTILVVYMDLYGSIWVYMDLYGLWLELSEALVPFQ